MNSLPVINSAISLSNAGMSGGDEPLLTKTMHQISCTISYTLYPISYLIFEHIRYDIIYVIIRYQVRYLVQSFEWGITVYTAHLNCLILLARAATHFAGPRPGLSATHSACTATLLARAATHSGVHRDPACACCDSFWRAQRFCLCVLRLILRAPRPCLLVLRLILRVPRPCSRVLRLILRVLRPC
jgi:hypothetical protein